MRKYLVSRHWQTLKNTMFSETCDIQPKTPCVSQAKTSHFLGPPPRLRESRAARIAGILHRFLLGQVKKNEASTTDNSERPD